MRVPLQPPISKDGAANGCCWPGCNALKAFADRRVYTLLPFNWYTTNIGTVLADTYAIGKILHPQHFSDVDVEKKADDLFTFLVGRPVYAEMKKDYGPIGQTAPFLK